MKVAQSLWATYCSVWLQVFPAFGYSCFSLCLLCHPFAVHHCEKPSSIFLMTDILIGTGRLLSSLLEAFPSPGWKSPVSLVSPHMANAPALDHPGGPLLSLVWFIHAFPILEAKAGCSILGVVFSQPSGGAPAHIAQYRAFFAVRIHCWLMFCMLSTKISIPFSVKLCVCPCWISQCSCWPAPALPSPSEWWPPLDCIETVPPAPIGNLFSL